VHPYLVHSNPADVSLRLKAPNLCLRSFPFPIASQGIHRTFWAFILLSRPVSPMGHPKLPWAPILGFTSVKPSLVHSVERACLRRTQLHQPFISSVGHPCLHRTPTQPVLRSSHHLTFIASHLGEVVLGIASRAQVPRLNRTSTDSPVSHVLARGGNVHAQVKS
jgi:hypothetical protein